MTEQQLKLLTFIRAFVAEHEYSPSYDQMAAHLGLASKSGVHRLIVALEERGKIVRVADRARSVSPVNAAPTPDNVSLANRLSSALMDAHGFDDGDGVMLVCSEKELRRTILAALTR